jgi:hypothetical protein
MDEVKLTGQNSPKMASLETDADRVYQTELITSLLNTLKLCGNCVYNLLYQ